jgi:hypothetical protein
MKLLSYKNIGVNKIKIKVSKISILEINRIKVFIHIRNLKFRNSLINYIVINNN